MIDLNKEAEEYSNSQIEHKPHYSLTDSFIAGANSKYVKQQILQAQIDILHEFNNHTTAIIERIKLLQKELKQFEDE